MNEFTRSRQLSKLLTDHGFFVIEASVGESIDSPFLSYEGLHKSIIGEDGLINTQSEYVFNETFKKKHSIFL